MRRIAKTDSNQQIIVQALRDAGCTVQPLHQMGGGIPDLLVATPSGETLLVEVKSAKGSLTPEQEQWISRWRGRVAVVRTVEEALAAVGVN